MKAQRLSLDRISALPPPIIESILCFLPIQEAGRTSILSKEWRYSWTGIPKLVFDEDTFQVSSNDENKLSALENSFEDSPNERKNMSKRCKLFYSIFQVLLLHQDKIEDFTLSMATDDTCIEIDQILLHLSRKNTVKKLNLRYMYRLPLHVSSFHQLTDLYLEKCICERQATFSVFGSVTTLHVDDVCISKKTLVRFLSNFPSLKTLSLLQDRESIYSDDDSGLIELFQCLPVIEHLTISLWGIMCFGEALHPRELPTPLVHLKYLSLESMNFIASFCYGLPFLALLIRASPNLKKIKLLMETYPDLVLFPFEKKLEIKSEQSDADEDYSDIRLENLNELEIVNFNNLKPDLEFVKLMLAKSPVLKKVKIFLNNEIDEDEELEMLTLLSSYPHASAVVDITVPGRFKWNF